MSESTFSHVVAKILIVTDFFFTYVDCVTGLTAFVSTLINLTKHLRFTFVRSLYFAFLLQNMGQLLYLFHQCQAQKYKQTQIEVVSLSNL